MARTVKTEMSDSVKMVELPLEDAKDKQSVRSGLREAFPNYRVASILRDDENERWLARLVEQDGRVHHKLADDKDAPFPLKELGPEGGDDDSDEEPKDDASDSDSDEEPKDDEDLAEDGPDEEEPKDDKGELKDLLKSLKKLIPEMEKIVGPLDEDEGPHDLDKLPEDVGPVPGNGGPPMGGPPGAPPGGPPGRPPAGMAPPRRPGVPGGRPRPGAPPGVPAFSKAQKLALQRSADVTADEAKAELLAEHPDYEITDFQESNGLFKAILEPKATK